MAAIQSFADFYKIDPDLFAASGAFNPVLSVDTRLFIDPRLLTKTTVEEFKNSTAAIGDYFAQVMLVVTKIKKVGDPFWKAADALLTFPEVNGLCIGYSINGNAGSGMGPELRAELLNNVMQIVEAGVDDPVLFELVGVFQDKVGPDRISDMIAKIIIADLVKFTQRVCSDCGIPMETVVYSKKLPSDDLPINPLTMTPIILVPKELLSDLPIANHYGDIREITAHNQELRDELNMLIGSSLSAATLADRKKATRNTFIKYPDILRHVLQTYLKAQPSFYDFENDPSGEVIWYEASKKVVDQQPLSLSLSAKPTLDEVEAVVIKICEHFGSLVTNNQLAKLLYDAKDKPKHESAAQLLFFGIASAYCAANDLDLSPESDAGRGPVDFKISSGFTGKVLVEIKLTSNYQLRHGFEAQLPIYQAAEGTTRGIYLVIDNGGYTEARMAAFQKATQEAIPPCPRLMWVDGSVRQSASKADE